MNKVSKILLGIGIILLSISLFLYIYYYMENIYSSKMVNKTMNKLINNIDIKKSDNGFDIKIWLYVDILTKLILVIYIN